MGMFDGLFGGGGYENPSKVAMPYLNKIEPMAKQYLNPYIGQGQQAYGQISGPLNNMTSDPTGFLEAIMQHYQPSRGYQLKRDEGLRAAANTAAAGGMRGSMQDIENESRFNDSLMGDDMQQWLQNVLGIQGTGMQGQQDLYDTGYGASKSLENELANLFAQQGNLAMSGQMQNNLKRAHDFSSVAQGIGGLAGLMGWL